MSSERVRNPFCDTKRSVGRSRKRKRSFKGQRRRSVERDRDPFPRPSSASSSKISDDEYLETAEQGYMLFDLNILFKSLRDNLCCNKCGSAIQIREVRIHGLGGTFEIKCQKCPFSPKFNTCSMIGKNNNVFEINRRSILASRCVGQGHVGLAKFCGLMDLPPPVKQSTYKKVIGQLVKATTEVATTMMHAAAEEEIRASKEPEAREIVVQCDGTWQKRGFSSLNGVCAVLGTETGKVLDIEVLSRFCKACANWKGKQSGERWNAWYRKHKNNCQANHQGSSGAMEVNGMVRIFKRSEQVHNAKYIGYIGDGDTKSYASVVKAEPYGPDVTIEKLECCGHVQKRLGSRMRKLKTRLRGQKLSDGKTISGKGRLTDKAIDQMQSYYGNAIRNNAQSVEGMKNAIWAIWYHKSSTDQKPQHHLCPEGHGSWCKYQQAIAAGTVDTFKHRAVLPAAVMNEVRPIFVDLSEDSLLKRCVGGKTQNANESLNSVIWKLCPKTLFSGREVVQVAANIAAVTFSHGQRGMLEIMQKLSIEPRRHAFAAAKLQDLSRIKSADRRAEQRTKEARVALRQLRMNQQEEAVEMEGCSYERGAF